jgi:hypothetical protein
MASVSSIKTASRCLMQSILPVVFAIRVSWLRLLPILLSLTDDGGFLAVAFSDLEDAVGEICNYPDQLLFEQSQLDADTTLLDFFLHLDNNGLRLLHTRWYPASRLNQCTAQCSDGINNDSDKHGLPGRSRLHRSRRSE